MQRTDAEQRKPSKVCSNPRLAFLLLEVAADKHKAQRKQAKDEGVFLRLRDDGAVDSDLYVVERCKKSSSPISSRKEISNRFVDDARANPNRRIPDGIGQGASRDANP